MRNADCIRREFEQFLASGLNKYIQFIYLYNCHKKNCLQRLLIQNNRYSEFHGENKKYCVDTLTHVVPMKWLYSKQTGFLMDTLTTFISFFLRKTNLSQAVNRGFVLSQIQLSYSIETLYLAHRNRMHILCQILVTMCRNKHTYTIAKILDV